MTELNIRNSSNTGWINLLDSSFIKLESDIFPESKNISEGKDSILNDIKYLTNNQPVNIFQLDIVSISDLSQFTPIQIQLDSNGNEVINKATSNQFDGILLTDVKAGKIGTVLLKGGSVSILHPFTYGKTYYINNLGNMDSFGTPVFRVYPNYIIKVVEDSDIFKSEGQVG